MIGQLPWTWSWFVKLIDPFFIHVKKNYCKVACFITNYMMLHLAYLVTWHSGVATGVARGAECHPWQRKNCQKSGKIRKKSGNIGKSSGKIGKKEEKSGRKGKNREVSFTLPRLTDRAGYATDMTASAQVAKVNLAVRVDRMADWERTKMKLSTFIIDFIAMPKLIVLLM